MRLRVVPAAEAPSPTTGAAQESVQLAEQQAARKRAEEKAAREKAERDAYERPTAQLPQHVIDNSDRMVATLEGIEDALERQAALRSIYFDADGVLQARTLRVRAAPELPRG